MEEYITVRELSKRCKLAEQTVYNMIYKKTFVLNQHYFKPSPRKILFKWSAVKIWLKGNHSNVTIKSSDPASEIGKQQTPAIQNKSDSLINI